MKRFLFFLPLLLFIRCHSEYPALYYTGTSARHDSRLLWKNGFYFYCNGCDSVKEGQRNMSPIGATYFYNDGTLRTCSWSKSARSLKGTLALNALSRKKQELPGAWGFYAIRNDTVLMEYVIPDSTYPKSKGYRSSGKGLLRGSRIEIFERTDIAGKSDFTPQTWYFEADTLKPDSTKNTLRKIKQYRRN